MIVKIAPNRRDGKSSFKDLAKYVTKGIEQSGEAPQKTSWDNLTQYITAQSVLNELGDNVEKTIGVEIGNLSSLATAPAEMYAVANMATRVKNPVYHYILSWPEHERPSTQDIFSAARDTLQALGMAEHQYIIAIHANTDNLHAHIEVNRIHPKSFKPQHLHFDFATLHEAVRRAEIKFGWHHDNGMFKVVELNGKKSVVRNTEYIDPDLVTTQPGANQAEVWSGEESLETWCKGTPTTELKRTLDDASSKSWQDIHRVLARHGLELKDAGGGGLKVVDVSSETAEKSNKPLAVRASAAFRFLKRKELEMRFGAFEPRSPNLILDEPIRTYKRDPYKRLESRLARKELRDALQKRFKSEEQSARTKQAQTKDALKPLVKADKDRHQKLKDAYAAQRAIIRSSKDLSPTQKQQAYMLAKLTMDKARDQLVKQIGEERAVRRGLFAPIPVWREWVEQLAQTGDEAAISAMRGMIYQDGRDLKKKIARDAMQANEDAILPAKPQDTDPQIRKLSDLNWKVSKNGRVNYSFNDGAPAFQDEGERLTFGRKDVSDAALSLSLQYGADRWKDGIKIAGGDFAFKERAVRLAVINGITIKNTELRGLENQIRAEIAAMKKAGLDPSDLGLTPTLTQSMYLNAVSVREDDIDVLLRGVDRRAKLTNPNTIDRSYKGTIAAQNARYIAQDVGNHEYVLHERSAFKQTPEHGSFVTIQYRSGVATLATSKNRNGRGNR